MASEEAGSDLYLKEEAGSDLYLNAKGWTEAGSKRRGQTYT